MNRRSALLVLALLLAPAPAPASEEEGRPWEGFLPDPGQCGPGVEDGPPGSEWFGVRVLDAATGRPVPGARWVRTPEAIHEGNLRHDAVMAMAVANGDGIARMRSEGWRNVGDSHWLVLADGYAPAHEYAVVPETEVLLERGQPFRGVLLDPMGRPAAGGVVEFLGGCSHGTAALRAEAAADGSFAIPPHGRGGQYWIEGPGIASDLLAADNPCSLGSRPGVVVAPEAGLRFEGRVVDVLGRPVAGCVVRCWNEQRGPTAMTGSDGRFVIDGCGDGNLLLYPENDGTGDASDWNVGDGRPGVPMTVVITSLGVVEEEEDARVRIRAFESDGTPVSEVAFQILSASTGRGPSGETSGEYPADPDDPRLGEALEEIPAGRFRVVCDDHFGEFEFDPVEGEVAAGAEAVVALVLRPRPRLRVKGAIPAGTWLFLALPDGEEDGEWDPENPFAPRLPSSGPAALRVEMEGAPPFFFPVGPEKDGVREVAVTLPRPRRVVLPKGALEAELRDGWREVACRSAEGGGLETWAEGRVTLLWIDGMKQERTLDIDLPPLEGGVVEVGPDEGRPVGGKREVRLLFTGEDGAEESEAVEVDPGEMAVFRDEGWQTLRVPAPVEGSIDVRRGPCVLELTLVGKDGDPIDALVSVDGEIHAAPEGRLLLRGLDPGPRLVRALLHDEVGGGRELTVVLAEGPPSRRTIRL